MKKAIATVLAVVMVLACAMTAFASSSKSSGGSVVSKSSKTVATTVVNAAGLDSTWSYDAAKNTWTCGNFKKQWALVKNPYAGNASQWFYFNENGIMLTGWQWILCLDGVTRCYYLNPVHDGNFGACYINGLTPDGYTVDENGAWTVNGVVQTR